MTSPALVSVRRRGCVNPAKVEIKFHLDCKIFPLCTIYVTANALHQLISKY